MYKEIITVSFVYLYIFERWIDINYIFMYEFILKSCINLIKWLEKKKNYSYTLAPKANPSFVHEIHIIDTLAPYY